MLATRIETHQADAVSRLLEQLRGRPNITGIINALNGPTQVLEDVAFSVCGGRMLVDGSAVGAQLDGIGSIVGLSRNGLDDPTFRLLILGTIAQNNSHADIETILRIVQIVFSATYAMTITPESFGHSQHRGAASLAIEVGSPKLDPSLYTIVLGILRRSIAATVALSYVVTADATSAFALAGADTGLGLGDINDASAGGMLASLVFSNPAD